jgi:predicted dithiol-disulfide oxidoreductase (DUF899 family)
MPTRDFVDADTWAAARAELLAAEKQLTRQRDAVAAERREMPWREVGATYTFDGPDGPVTLADLFGVADQLVVMHFMYGPDWDDGCPSCSFWADTYDGTMAHLAARNTAYVVVSNAPLTELAAYQQRMGWSFPWYSCGGTTFGADFGVNPPAGSEPGTEWLYNGRPIVADEMPGISVFGRDDSGRIGLTYQTFARGLDPLNSTYAILDLTPNGRDENDLPWPMAWLRRHDEYAIGT